MAHLDEAVTGFGGIALRYGAFYGAARRRLGRPRCASGSSRSSGTAAASISWIHLDDAAAATVLALEHEGPAIFNVVDDEPAPVREWLPVLAEILGAKPPRRFPALARAPGRGRGGGRHGHEARGASNAKAKRELGWTPRYPSWRQGFPAAYSAVGVARDRPKPRPAARTTHSHG